MYLSEHFYEGFIFTNFENRLIQYKMWSWDTEIKDVEYCISVIFLFAKFFIKIFTFIECLVRYTENASSEPNFKLRALCRDKNTGLLRIYLSRVLTLEILLN
jgi:hypothetical protein